MFLEYRIARERREEIAEIAESLRVVHKVKNVDYGVAWDICETEGIHLHTFEFLPTAYYFRRENDKYILLPEMRDPVFGLNFGHELGHLLLATHNELEVEFFSSKLSRINIEKNYALTLLAAIPLARKLYRGIKRGDDVEEQIRGQLERKISDQTVVEPIMTDVAEVVAKYKKRQGIVA